MRISEPDVRDVRAQGWRDDRIAEQAHSLFRRRLPLLTAGRGVEAPPRG